MQPLVSIIIPTYNRAHLIGETLDSVLSQTYENWECIVVDDGSTDYTQELLYWYTEIDKRIQFYKRPKYLKKGANSCRNFGFKVSEGDYVQWFDSDDLMHPNKLNFQVLTLEKSKKNFSVCQTLIFEKKRSNIVALRHHKINSNQPFEDYLQQKIVWLTQAPIFKRKFIQNLPELFNESLQAAQEWEFFCRILAVCPEYHFTNKELVYIRKHSESISYSEDSNFRQAEYFFSRFTLFNCNTIYFNATSLNYLKNYLEPKLRQILRSGKDKNRIKASLLFLKCRRVTLFSKICLIVAFFSFKFLKRGDVFLKAIKF